MRQFAACLNQDFEIVFSDGALPLKLSEARPLGRPTGINPRAVRAHVSSAGRDCGCRKGFTKCATPRSARWKFSSSRSPPIKPAAPSKRYLIRATEGTGGRPQDYADATDEEIRVFMSIPNIRAIRVIRGSNFFVGTPNSSTFSLLPPPDRSIQRTRRGLN